MYFQNTNMSVKRTTKKYSAWKIKPFNIRKEANSKMKKSNNIIKMN